MSDRRISVAKSWLKPLELGMKLKAVSHRNPYEGQTMEIIGLEHDQENPMNGYAILKLERKVEKKLTAKPRFWWIYENCILVGHVKGETS